MLSGLKPSAATLVLVVSATLGWEASLAAQTSEQFYATALRDGDRLREQGDLKQAMELYQRAERSKATGEIAVRIGDLYSRSMLGRPEAVKAYEAALKRDNGVLGARLGLARLAFSERPIDVAKVVKLLGEEEALQPGREDVAAFRRQVQPVVDAAEARRRAKVEEATKAAEDEKRDQESRAKIQSQLARVGMIECRPIVYEELGESIGNDIAATTASGVYVAALVKCTNVGKKTVQMNSPDFTLVDSSGRRYAVDSKGSYYQSVTASADSGENDKHRTPEMLQLHPGVTTSIVTVFDVPTNVAQAPGLKLDVRGAKVQLTFADGENARSTSSTKSAH